MEHILNKLGDKIMTTIKLVTKKWHESILSAQAEKEKLQAADKLKKYATLEPSTAGGMIDELHEEIGNHFISLSRAARDQDFDKSRAILVMIFNCRIRIQGLIIGIEDVKMKKKINVFNRLSIKDKPKSTSSWQEE